MSFVRNHTTGTSSSGTAVAATLAANVASGNLLVVWVAMDNTGTTTPTVSSIDKPGGETASWARIASHDASSATSAAAVRGEMWVIRTTQQWNSGTDITATLSASPPKSHMLCEEHNGVFATLRGTSGTNTSAVGTPSAATSGTALVSGDLVIGGATFETSTTPTGDSDTTNGSWSTAHTGNTGGGATAAQVSSVMQWKYVTATGVQTYNPTANSTDSGAAVASLQFDPNTNVDAVTATATGVANDATISIPGVLALDLDVNALTGLADLDPIATFTDQSTEANSVTQATGTAQATYRTNQAPSGKSVARFDGGDFYTKGSAPTSMATQEFTWFAVVNSSLFGDNRIIMVAGASNGGREWRLNASGQQMLIKCNTADLLTGTATRTTGTWYIVAVRYKTDGTINFYKSDGSGDGSTTSVANFTDASADLWMGEHTGGGGKWTGDIAQVKAYNYARTDIEVTNEITALDTKWLQSGNVSVDAENASGSGNAQDAAVTPKSVFPTTATASGDGQAASVSTGASATPTTHGVIGSMIPGSAVFGRVPPAPTGTVANALTATAVGNAQNSQVAITASAVAATATGDAQNVQGSISASAVTATAIGNAETASITGTTTVSEASATGNAETPNASVGVSGATATAIGTAVDGAATTALLVEDFESFSSSETWADASTHGQWFVQFDGKATGNGVGIETDSGSKVHFQLPDVATDPDEGDETHASLVTSISTFRSDVQYFELSSRVKTVQQLRQNLAPHAWEVAWFVWHYTDNDHFYYFTLKPNGYELGKRHPAYTGSQRFLATGASPTLTIGAWNRFRIVQSTDATITVYVDGTQVVQFQDTGGPQGDAAYIGGSIGLYNEDAYVRFDDIAVNAAIPQSATATGDANNAVASTTNFTTANAIEAIGAGTSQNAQVTINTSAIEAIGQGDAQNASTNVSASAAGAIGTGDSQSPQDTVAPIVQVATATGDAQNTQTTIVVNAIEATAVGDGLNATTTTANVTNVNPIEATGAGDAQNISATVASNIQAATATGDGQDVQASIFPSALAATATGDGQNVQNINIASGIQSADAIGDALQPAIATGTLAFPTSGDGIGIAFDAQISIFVNPQQIVNAGDAQQPSITVGTLVPATEATGLGVAQDAQSAISAAVIAATANGDAQNAVAAVAVVGNAQAATGIGDAQTAQAITVASVVDVAAVVGQAQDATITIGGLTNVDAITATGFGDGQNGVGSVGADAQLGTGTATTFDSAASIRATAELIIAIAIALDAEFTTGKIVAIPYTTYILSNILTTYVEIADTAERKSNELVLGVGV